MSVLISLYANARVIEIMHLLIIYFDKLKYCESRGSVIAITKLCSIESYMVIIVNICSN